MLVDSYPPLLGRQRCGSSDTIGHGRGHSVLELVGFLDDPGVVYFYLMGICGEGVD